jgi:hypothetical protein
MIFVVAPLETALVTQLRNVQQKEEQMMELVPLALEFAAFLPCLVEEVLVKIKHIWFKVQLPR